MSGPPAVLFRILAVLSIPLLGLALFVTLRLSLADYLARRGDLGSLNRAISLVPDHAGYYLRRAELSLETASSDLRRAAELRPRDAAPWVGLALLAESRGRIEEAESHLLHAARLDASFLPRWSLVNFYFRQQKWDSFWEWAARAARIYHGDLTALYQVCVRAGGSAQEILDKVAPDRPKAHRELLVVFTEDKRYPDAIPAALALLSHHRAGDTRFILNLSDRLLAIGQTEAALDLWNRLAHASLIPHAELDPPRGRSLTNADFQVQPSGMAFDWRLREIEGVRLGPGYRPGLEIRFSGRQPAESVLASQTLPVMGGRRYCLRWKAEAELSGAAPRWRIGDRTAALAEPEGELEFLAPAEASALNLELVTLAEPGTTRAEGTLRLHSLRLQPATD
ncbi:MAG: hypothetical protein FJW20_10175 [Acidimicrobiia bacterium]|nr:hypothetical protein [Acidimicrobiia bacterium]